MLGLVHRSVLLISNTNLNIVFIYYLKFPRYDIETWTNDLIFQIEIDIHHNISELVKKKELEINSIVWGNRMKCKKCYPYEMELCYVKIPVIQYNKLELNSLQNAKKVNTNQKLCENSYRSMQFPSIGKEI